MNSNYTLKDLLILIVLFVLAVCLVSCGTPRNLEQIRIEYEMNKLWDEYQYKSDSLIIEYNKH